MLNVPSLEPRYSVEAVAAQYNVIDRTVIGWIKKGWLRAIRPGKSYFIPASALREFEERFTVDGVLLPEAADQDEDDAELRPASGE